MNKNFIWIDESYDQICTNGNKFYVLCAIKINATPSQVCFSHSKSGLETRELHSHVLKAYDYMRCEIRRINKNIKNPKKKLRISEFHENQLVLNKKTKKLKTLFLEYVFLKDSNLNIKIYYVYYNFRNNNFKNDKQLYKHMAKELLNLCCTPSKKIAIIDICLDQFTSLKEHQEIISFLRRKCNIGTNDIIKFDDSQSNYGLQVVDLVVGTVRRFLHGQEKNKEDYNLIKSHIINFKNVSIEDEKIVNM